MTRKTNIRVIDTFGVAETPDGRFFSISEEAFSNGACFFATREEAQATDDRHHAFMLAHHPDARLPPTHRAQIMIDTDRELLQAATALMEGVASEIDGWFPGDPRPTIQTDLRTVARRLRKRYGLREFVPDDQGGHLEDDKPS